MGNIPIPNQRAEIPGHEEEEMHAIGTSYLAPVERRRRVDSSSSKTPYDDECSAQRHFLPAFRQQLRDDPYRHALQFGLA